MRGLMAAVASLSDQEISTVVLTHAHGDHANGAANLSGSRILASSASCAELANGTSRWPSLFPDVQWGSVPSPILADLVPVSSSIILADLPVELMLIPSPAHTSGDLVAWLPEQRVLFAGDLAWNGVVPLTAFGSVAGWREALIGLVDLAPLDVVPGHGPVGGTELLSATDGYLSWLETAASVLAGSDLEVEIPRYLTLVADPLPEWLEPERHAVNLMRAALDVSKETMNWSAAIRILRTAYGGNIRTSI